MRAALSARRLPTLSFHTESYVPYAISGRQKAHAPSEIKNNSTRNATAIVTRAATNVTANANASSSACCATAATSRSSLRGRCTAEHTQRDENWEMSAGKVRVQSKVWWSSGRGRGRMEHAHDQNKKIKRSRGYGERAKMAVEKKDGGVRGKRGV